MTIHVHCPICLRQEAVDVRSLTTFSVVMLCGAKIEIDRRDVGVTLLYSDGCKEGTKQ